MNRATHPPPIAIIGGGTMGLAVVSGSVTAAGILHHAPVFVGEPDPGRHDAFKELGVGVTTSAADAVRVAIEHEHVPGEAQVLLCVKPQSLAAVAAELCPLLAGEPRVVVSILAGTPSATIREQLGGGVRVVRAMPNLPAKIRQGTTAICLGAGSRIGDEATARAIFAGVGQLVVTIDEPLMDAFTAVAGSGPAYLFYLAEAMIDAAVKLGFDPLTARDVVRETLAGAGNLLADSHESPASLRAAVTSKGGTTEAACRVLDQRRVAEAMVDAIIAARDRGRELARDRPPT